MAMTTCEWTWESLDSVASRYGDAFYLLDLDRFTTNYRDFLGAFRKHYPGTRVAYSYKANYTPAICRRANELGALAEVVSDMELGLARSVGVPVSSVIFNGPCKKPAAVEEVVLGGGMVNLDSARDVRALETIARRHPARNLKVGLRCNFDIGEGSASRFGFDAEPEPFGETLRRVAGLPNVAVRGIHCHFPNRNIESFVARIERMLAIARRSFGDRLDFINIGGGFCSRMPDSLKSQFRYRVPSYEEYASEVGSRMAAHVAGLPAGERPALILEPGSALVADAMRFASRVVSVKRVRGRGIATVAGSSHNVPASGSINLPVALVKRRPGSQGTPGERFDVGGYTCIEGDCLYRGFEGNIEEDDFLVFGNAGSYSVVLKPPFILPNVAVLERTGADGGVRVVKRPETADDVFATFVR